MKKERLLGILVLAFMVFTGVTTTSFGGEYPDTIEDNAPLKPIREQDKKQYYVKQDPSLVSEKVGIVLLNAKSKNHKHKGKCVFQLIAAEDIMGEDKKIRLKKGEIGDIVTVNNEGIGKSKELFLGKYNIVEMKASPQYEMEKKVVMVDLMKGKELDGLHTVYLEVMFTLGTGSLEITNASNATGNLLKGSGIEVLNPDKEILFQSRTNKAGKIVFHGLKKGNYYFRQFESPKGFTLENGAFPFKITSNNQVVKCELFNNPVSRKSQDDSPITGDDQHNIILLILKILIISGTIVALVCVIGKVKGMKL
ncbi:MAG: SpaA isopeptide-forming pilin-related protein [Anaerovoracaceae bacterium]